MKEYIDTDAKKIWSGTLDAASQLNTEVTTAFPVIEAVGQLAPGLYVMTARPGDDLSIAGEDDERWETVATQWFSEPPSAPPEKVQSVVSVQAVWRALGGDSLKTTPLFEVPPYAAVL
jgi:hypothetical protein